MPSATIVMTVLKASLFLLVFGIGLHANPGDGTYLIRRPGLLARSFLAMFVCMPLFAVWMTKAFALRPIVALSLVALTLSPVPPVLPIKVDRAAGTRSYILGLLVAASLAAIVIVPLEVRLLSAFLGLPFEMRPATVAKLMGTGVLLPLGLGLLLRRVAPSLADRIGKPLLVLATIVLLVALVPVVVKAWPAMGALIGNGTLFAIIAITVAGVVTGHLLGGPSSGNRTVLALATPARHPAVAIAIVSASGTAASAASAAVLLALLVGAIASLPYVVWRKREKSP
jgi:BASS family bile acid:Na+ symporter